jgi:hypothetical protein
MNLYMIHILLLYLRFISPFCNHLDRQHVLEPGVRRTYFGIFFSPVAPPPCPPEGFLASASLTSGAGRGTTFSINSSFNGAGYPVATHQPSPLPICRNEEVTHHS